MLCVVACGDCCVAPVLNACTASARAPGATPIRRSCATIAPAMPVPCVCGLSGLPTASKRSAMPLASSGCASVDLGVDHRDHHVLAGRDLVHLGEPQLVGDVLLVVAAGRGLRRRGFGLPGSGRLAGSKRSSAARRSARPPSRAPRRGARGCRRWRKCTSVAPVSAERCVAMIVRLCCRAVSSIRCGVRRDPTGRPFRCVTKRVSLDRRHAGEIALAGQGIARHAGADREHLAAVGEALHLPQLRRRGVHGAHARIAIGEAARARTGCCRTRAWRLLPKPPCRLPN